MAAGLTLWNFYFRLYPGSIKKAQVLDFLQALVRHLRGPLLLVWDRLPGHRSRLVQDYIAGLQGWIHQEYLPAYAPELNPVEFIWAHWKQHELPNVCPHGRSFSTATGIYTHDPVDNPFFRNLTCCVGSCHSERNAFSFRVMDREGYVLIIYCADLAVSFWLWGGARNACCHCSSAGSSE